MFCLPSTYEGFGVPYIEAMASGTPVVASPNVGAREILEEGKWGVVASDEQLADDIVQILTDPRKRSELEMMGLQRAARYSWNQVLDEYESLYAGKFVRSDVQGMVSHAQA